MPAEAEQAFERYVSVAISTLKDSGTEKPLPSYLPGPMMGVPKSQ